MDTKTGIELISEERERQVSVEGWTPEHDDEHDDAALTQAAKCYANRAQLQITEGWEKSSPQWPWDVKWWKPSDDPVRNLVKAGALIAAEIDRLQRQKARG